MLPAEIVAIGSELLTPYHTDTNSLWLTEQLNAVGIEVKLKTIVGDDEARLEEMLRDAWQRSRVIISTGGLGPTEDDITRKVFAKVLDRPLELHPEILAGIQALFEKRGLVMSPNNERQAMILSGATVLPNSKGTAPGILVSDNNRYVVMLPGPPREMKPMFTEHVLPVLAKLSQGVRICRRTLKVVGLGESAVDSLIAPIYRQYQNPTTTILFNMRAEVNIHFTATAATEFEANQLLDELTAKVSAVLGDNLFAWSDEHLEQVVGRLLLEQKATLAVAESCTGGLLAMRLTDTAGSSAYFQEGFITYTAAAKMTTLGVPVEIIAQDGVVSAAVAEAMALGARTRAGTTFGLGITGIAGPTGATAAQPVGTVFVGLATPTKTIHRALQLPGDRDRIRWLAATAALDLLRRRGLNELL
jgi:nicotinamide-nucleotide amidase